MSQLPVNPFVRIRAIGAIAVVFLCVGVLTLAACATGSAIVTGNARDPVAPDQVKIYLDPPASFETIGLVSASSDAGITQQWSSEYAMAELKKQAAKLGANGVLLVSSGVNTTNAKTVQGKAIFVKAQ